jgi:SMODS and SLOG-associating 2TM effector domain family 4
MFELTLVDHLRLTFGHVVYRHRAHTLLAHKRARWNRWMRAAEAVLMVGSALAGVAALFGQGRGALIASVAAACLAVTILLIDLAFDLGRSALAHGSCATRLWQIREQYRALLSDLTDGALDLEAARRRRDALMAELHGIYENAPPTDPQAYQTAARAIGAAEEAVLTDEEIDLFLPKSLQKSGKPEAAA